MVWYLKTSLVIFIFYVVPVMMELRDIGLDSKCISTFSNAFKRKMEKNSKRYDSEIVMTAPEIIRNRKYKVEVHHVITEDGYILEVDRIPGNGTTVLLVHGIAANAACFVVNTDKTSLAFQLANRNYDVYLPNLRGAFLSRNHTKLDPFRSTKFWDYSFHEMGVYDIPAILKLITKVSGQEKIFYIGWSQGCAAFFVALSEHPQLNKNFRAMFALGPAVIMNSIHPGAKLICDFLYLTQLIPQSGGLKFPVSVPLITRIIQSVCNQEYFENFFCITAASLVAGINYDLVEKKTFTSFLAHTVREPSLKRAQHLCQAIKKGGFRQFDYGAIGNMLHYKRRSPPSYKLKKITVKVFIYSGTCDLLTTPANCRNLHKTLPNSVLDSVTGYTHISYISASNDDTVLFPRILGNMSLL